MTKLRRKGWTGLLVPYPPAARASMLRANSLLTLRVGMTQTSLTGCLTIEARHDGESV